jgi:DNA replication and repair protein RecF
MLINTLTLTNYRNFTRQRVTFPRGLTIIVGDNGEGKTNLVEAIYLCSLGKSPRTDKDKELVRMGASVAHVRAEYTSRYGDGVISVGLDVNNAVKKHVSVNSVPITKLGELLGYFNCIYFSPSEIKIVNQSPTERRKFLDIDLSVADKGYFHSLKLFNKALLQRNNLLKSSQTLEQLKKTIFVWDSQIAENGAKVIYKRRQFVEKLKSVAAKCHSMLSEEKETLVLNYSTQVKGDTVADIAAEYLKLLESSIEKDFSLRYTSAGAQRDDIGIMISDKDLRSFGSQGQQRTAALALKLSELEIFADTTGEMPVLILDDVLSELDISRQRQLLEYANKCQVILTTATEVGKDILPEKYTKYRISAGSIID